MFSGMLVRNGGSFEDDLSLGAEGGCGRLWLFLAKKIYTHSSDFYFEGHWLENQDEEHKKTQEDFPFKLFRLKMQEDTAKHSGSLTPRSEAALNLLLPSHFNTTMTVQPGALTKALRKWFLLLALLVHGLLLAAMHAPLPLNPLGVACVSFWKEEWNSVSQEANPLRTKCF